MHAFAAQAANERLRAGSGGYEIVHESPRLEVDVYVVVLVIFARGGTDA